MKAIARLHAITQNLPHISHAEQARRACAGGAKWIQPRVKKADAATLRAEARATLAICQAAGAALIINDHAPLAAEIGAAGVHLGKQDFSPDEARRMLGPAFLIGGTANTFADILRLADMGVDYIGLGPFRFTETKENLSPILGLEGYRNIALQCREAGIGMPVIAIGGIREGDVAAIRETGMYGVAVSSAINLAEAPEQATAAFLHALFNIE